jgi:hypothetical protein
MFEMKKVQSLVAYTYHSTVNILIETIQVLIMVAEEVEEQEQQEEEGVVVVVEHFELNDFHLNDLMMIEGHQMVVVVEKNYFEMIDDCYKMMMVGHSVLA